MRCHRDGLFIYLGLYANLNVDPFHSCTFPPISTHSFIGSEIALPLQAEPGGSRSLFGFGLPPEVIERILHFLSDRPSHVYSHDFVGARDVLAFFGKSVQLCTAALKVFHDVQLVFLKRHDASRHNLNLVPPGRLVFDQSKILSALLSALGSELRVLSVHLPWRFEPWWGEVLAREMPPITHLELYGQGPEFLLEKLLSACACSALKRLCLDESDVRTLECVAEHAPQITALELHNTLVTYGRPCNILRNFRLTAATSIRIMCST